MFMALFRLFYMFENFKAKVMVGAEEQEGAGRTDVGGIRATSRQGHCQLLPCPTAPPAGRGLDPESCWALLPEDTHRCAVPPLPVCKYVAVELKSAFEETGKTKEVLDTGYGILDRKASGVKYTKS